MAQGGSGSGSGCGSGCGSDREAHSFVLLATVSLVSAYNSTERALSDLRQILELIITLSMV